MEHPIHTEHGYVQGDLVILILYQMSLYWDFNNYTHRHVINPLVVIILKRLQFYQYIG